MPKLYHTTYRGAKVLEPMAAAAAAVKWRAVAAVKWGLTFLLPHTAATRATKSRSEAALGIARERASTTSSEVSEKEKARARGRAVFGPSIPFPYIFPPPLVFPPVK